MRKILCLILIALGFNIRAEVVTDSKIIDQITTNLKASLPDLKIDQINTTLWGGVYEIDSGRRVFYVDGTGTYAFIGNMINLKTQQNLTQARSVELNKIDWSQLPLNLAIYRQIGLGTNKIAIFTDPDCPFCKRLELETIPKLQNVKIYYYLFPLPIHANARAHAKQILCAENPESAILSFMAYNVKLRAYESCKNAAKLNQMESVATNIVQVTATPTIALPNGKLVYGLIGADELNQLIHSNTAESK